MLIYLNLFKDRLSDFAMTSPKDDRVVFNIMGNKYQLVLRIVFDYKTIQIKWFETHAEYDKIDVVTVNYKKK